MSKYRLRELDRTRFVVLSLLLVSLGFNACIDPPPPSRERVVVIFSDVTSSLKDSERKQVVTLTNKVVDSLPPGTRYFVYPVQIEAQKLEPIDEGTIMVQDQTADRVMRQIREKKIEDTINKLYEKIRSSKRPPDADGDPDNHTCIVGTLEFAQNRFKQFDSANSDFELIYVSDMIEQCNTTPMGKPVSLKQSNISEAIKLAQETNLNLDLSCARVSMIIPATNDTYVASGRPNLRDLRQFWEGILSHCGFTKELLGNRDRFYFSSGLPQYLETASN